MVIAQDNLRQPVATVKNWRITLEQRLNESKFYVPLDTQKSFR